MKVKRILPLAALSLVSVMAVTSCGNSALDVPETYDGVNTKIMIWATEAEKNVVEKVVEAYNAKQDKEENKFQFEYQPVEEGKCGTEVAKDPSADNAPALFLVPDDQIFNLQKQEILLEIGGAYKERVNHYNTGVSVTGASYGDKLFGFPVTSDNGYFTWYNKSLIDDTKIGSLEEILKTAQEKGKKVLLDITNGWYAPTFLMSPDACGTDSLRFSADADNKVSYTVNWDNEVGVKVSEYIGGLLKPYFDAGVFVTGGNDAIVAGFEDESILAAVSGTWMETDLTSIEGVGEKVGAAKLPSYHIDGKAYQMATFTGSKVFCINKLRPAAEQKAAAALADLLTNKESQLTRFETRATLPCNKEAAADARYTENVSIGGKALNETVAAGSIVQSLAAEGRYWKIGEAIGHAYIEGDLGDYANWQEFLTGNCEQLRQKR